MAMTRVFKSGNSQAVRIPVELQFERNDIEYEITREGDEIRIRPARRKLNQLADKFVAFTDDFMAGGRLDEENQERELL
ncbi:probable virulence-associated protein [gamma proteobacterium HdN1]|nr:probable virulence-associated protein [gamma proteobacterium HdN1]